MTRSSKKKAYALQVLLVNNDVEALTTFKKVLESSGIGADAFHDPRTALRHFKPNKYGTAALNIRLPHMTGFELAHAIWREDPAVKICFLSSFEIPEAEAKKVFKSFRNFCFHKEPISAEWLTGHLTPQILTDTAVH